MEKPRLKKVVPSLRFGVAEEAIRTFRQGFCQLLTSCYLLI
jgi:hypothetical protein